MVEYAVMVAVILAAILSISIYVKRSISGRWKEVADSFGHGRQYEYHELRDLTP